MVSYSSERLLEEKVILYFINMYCAILQSNYAYLHVNSMISVGFFSVELKIKQQLIALINVTVLIICFMHIFFPLCAHPPVLLSVGGKKNVSLG